MKPAYATLWIFLTATLPTVGAETASETPDLIPADQLAFFEKNIRPVLVEHCYKCHSATADKIKGGLALDTRQGLALGGESGHPAITPGKAEASPLYRALTWEDEDMQMPPKNKLPEAVVAHFRRWIEMGAPDPREQTTPGLAGGRREINIAEGRKHWAFQKPQIEPPPSLKEDTWARSTIDQWIQAGLEQAGLRPNPEADRRTLIRRIAYDLTGLPPTPEEVQMYLTDTSANATQRLIDQYLESPRFGERWGRHWLDVARYGESSGKEVNVLYPHAWRYRDYVIESFNKDKPYDQFLKEQIAGDLMRYESKEDQAEKIVATGFLAIGPKGHNSRDRRQFTLDVVDEQIDALSQSMLGLTLACARCHDHKFDPVTQRDYYALAGIFMSSETLFGTYQQLQNQQPGGLIELDRQARQPSALAPIKPTEYATLKRQHEESLQTVAETRREVLGMNGGPPPGNDIRGILRLRALNDRAEAVKADMDQFYDDGSPRTLAMGVLDRSRPVNSPLLMRGDLNQPGETIPRGLVEVLCAEGEPLNISEGSGRLDLAWFIASKDNPLTARVMVNRIWQKLMGSGLVATPDNFGLMGQKPTHPELLDYLAVSFMNQGWSVKKLIREIMLSRAYQMTSTHDAANFAADPDNRLHWRMNQRRLEAEAIRDGMLAVSGLLNLYPTTGSPVARAGEGREGILNIVREMTSRPDTARSVYQPVVRDQIPEFLSVFDFPDASLVNGERDSTNVPGQSLFLMNHPQVLSAADAFAARLAEHPGTPLERLSFAYELAFARPPSQNEMIAIRNFWTHFSTQVPTPSKRNQAEAEAAKRQTALAAFCQSLFASAEFRYLH